LIEWQEKDIIQILLKRGNKFRVITTFLPQHLHILNFNTITKGFHQFPMKLHFPEYSDCMLCPRQCHADRNSGILGYCKSDAGFHISSICRHRGEEPAISGSDGICNIFFSHCNLQCIYCQNHQISCNKSFPEDELTDFDEIINTIISLLDKGCRALGFVSPSHFIPHVHAIIKTLHDKNRHPVIVYNSNGYDTVKELQRLEGLIDIYLPDLKYVDHKISEEYSDAPDYPVIAKQAIKEMFRQKGSTLRYLDEVQAESGLIIRHLVLPGQIQNSIDVLNWIAEELSPRVHVSLMSQYYPTEPVAKHPFLGRALNQKEYREVTDEMKRLGMVNGWLQDIASNENYRPDFKKEHPFE
jgi:putative pyruvate formate lyase activating enzyme